MKRYLIKITLIILTLITTSCEYKKEDLIGEWNVAELSEYPLSITNYKDATLDKNSKLIIRENGKLDFYLKDSLTESYSYYFENNDLIMVYSDYGIPLDIIKLNSKELILETGGIGNTVLKRNRKIRIKLKK
jgi:hypothetical protein